MATAPELIRHYMELRGIGVVDVRQLFGMSAIKISQEIDMVIESGRPGMTTRSMTGWAWRRGDGDPGGVGPLHHHPVKPGRNLASIVEVAAINNRNRKMGHNAAWS